MKQFQVSCVLFNAEVFEEQLEGRNIEYKVVDEDLCGSRIYSMKLTEPQLAWIKSLKEECIDLY